jgi:hypothetical protein
MENTASLVADRDNSLHITMKEETFRTGEDTLSLCDTAALVCTSTVREIVTNN